MGVIGRTHRFAPTGLWYYLLCSFVRTGVLKLLHLRCEGRCRLADGGERLCYGFKYEINTVSSVGVDRCVYPNYSCFLILGVVVGCSLFLFKFFIALLWRKRAQNARHTERIVAVAHKLTTPPYRTPRGTNFVCATRD